MKLAIDARKLRDGGIGTYIRELVAALVAREDAPTVTALLDPADLNATGWPAGCVREWPVRAGKYSLWEHVTVPRAARVAGADLLHSPHYTLPWGWRGPSVVTIHDLIHIRCARFFAPGVPEYARVVAGNAARRARIVIADSTATRDDVVALLRTPVDKVRVIPLGVSPALAPRPTEQVAAFRAARGLPADYALYVGARKGHKNLRTIVEALGRLQGSARPPLVLSGLRWPNDDPLARLAAKHGLEVGFSGPLAGADDLACLYSGAAVYLQPSLIEGFGLPPLEAMACGVPVISSDGGALPETVGDAAVVLPAEDSDRWAAELASLMGDVARRAALVESGRTRAAGFTWKRTAELTLQAYREALVG